MMVGVQLTKAYDSESWVSGQGLFMGLFPQYMLGAIQGVLDELDIADDVFVKYSTDED